MWDTFKMKNVSLGVLKELMHVSSLNYLQICLVNTQLGSRDTIYICNEIRPLYNNKVFLQISLEKNPTNSSYIFILSVNFENLTIKLHVLITSLMLTKFQENQRSILRHQINVIILSFCNLNLYIKNKLIDQIVNNIQFE